MQWCIAIVCRRNGLHLCSLCTYTGWWCALVVWLIFYCAVCPPTASVSVGTDAWWWTVVAIGFGRLGLFSTVGYLTWTARELYSTSISFPGRVSKKATQPRLLCVFSTWFVCFGLSSCVKIFLTVFFWLEWVESNDWMSRLPPKWPTLCQVRRSFVRVMPCR